MKLSESTCVPPKSTDRPLAASEAVALLADIPSWSLTDKGIARALRFKDFREAMAFVTRVADVAEAQDHHPDIAISYNRVTLTLTTHKIGGLSKNDFILAAKIDTLPTAS